MASRPGSKLARRPLHFFVLADCSASMASDGKMQALNTALRETIPHLVGLASQNPHAQVLMRVIAFSDGARWHVEKPTPVESFLWEDLDPRGYTELGPALRLLSSQLRSGVIEERALPPAVLLISDGMPTDEDWQTALDDLLAEQWGQRAVRVAVGIGRDADMEVLERFMGPGEIGPVSAHNPEQLVRMIRWASVHASRAASNVHAEPPRFGPTPLDPDDDEVAW